MIHKDSKSAKRALEIVHEGVNFDFCRRITLSQMSDGFYKVKMEAYIMPKKPTKGDY